MKKRNRKKSILSVGHKKILKALVVGFGVVLFWRGAWGLMDLYLFPASPQLSFAASIVIGSSILAATHYFVKELLG